jgi:hypothetical protein
MDEFLKQNIDFVSEITLYHLVFSMISSSICALVLSFSYIKFHKTSSYSSSFTHSIILVSIIISLIMLIIGSNIARAFALVGAMSIVRFRNPVKDSLDLVYIFAAIAVGMACGTSFTIYAYVFTIFFIFVVYIIRITNYGLVNQKKLVVRIRLNINQISALEDLLNKYLTQVSILSIDKIDENNSEVMVEGTDDKGVVNEMLKKLDSDLKPNFINVLKGQNYINV